MPTPPDDDESRFRTRFESALSPEWREIAPALATHAWTVVELNRHVNLTRVTEPEQMARRHASDSLAAVPLLQNLGGSRIIDLGTGAGWPGLALALALPDRAFVLIDGTRKKIEIVREIATRLELAGNRVECRWARIEQVPREELEGSILVARAVGPIERIIGWLPKLQRVTLVLWKGPALDRELAEASSTLGRRGFRVSRRFPYRIPEDPAARELVVISRARALEKPS